MKVGLLGAGEMGAAFALRLLGSGHEVRVWNRTRSKAEKLEEHGATVAATPFDAARRSDVLLSMLADDDAVSSAVLEGRAPAIDGLARESTHLSMSTISPRLSARLARAHEEHGQGYVAAPVVGRPELASRGELVVVAAGAQDGLSRCAPILAALGKETHSLGEDAPSANLVKLAVNFMMATLFETLGEAYALVERYGVSDARFLEIANGALLKSPVLAAYGERIARNEFEPPGLRLRLGLKDLRLALEAAEARALAMPIGSVLRDRFIEAVELGMQNADWSAVGRGARVMHGAPTRASPDGR